MAVIYTLFVIKKMHLYFTIYSYVATDLYLEKKCCEI